MVGHSFEPSGQDLPPGTSFGGTQPPYEAPSDLPAGYPPQPWGYGQPQPPVQSPYNPAPPHVWGYGQPQPPVYGPPQAYGPPQPWGWGPVPPQAMPTQPLANQGLRLVARLIDDIIVAALAFGVVGGFVAIAAGLDGDHPTPPWVGLLAALSAIVVIVGYEAVQLALWGRTLGKRCVRVQVVGAPGQSTPLSLGQAFGRTLFFYVTHLFWPAALLNILFCTWDRPFQQCLHDKVAGTVVVTRQVSAVTRAGAEPAE